MAQTSDPQMKLIIWYMALCQTPHVVTNKINYVKIHIWNGSLALGAGASEYPFKKIEKPVK